MNQEADRTAGSGFSVYRLHIGILFLLSALLLFSNLHFGGLSGNDDALYAHEGEEMLKSGDWWSIRFNGGFHYEYPPMFFWLEALSMSVWGVTDFAAKFPAAVAGTVTIILVFLIGYRFQRNFLYPICAAWILMLTQYYLKYSMHAMTDVPYGCFFTLAILLYDMSMEKPGRIVLCGLAIACTVLIRSVLGFIPWIIIVSHSLFTRRFRFLISPLFLLSLCLSLALPSIWYFSQYSIHGRPFLAQALGVLTSKLSSENRLDLWYFLWDLTKYPRLLLTYYWPWIPFMLIGLGSQIKKALSHKCSSAALLAIWALVVVGLMSLAEVKLLRYIMPAFPVFALLAAVPISEWLMRFRHSPYLRNGYILFSLLVVGIVAFTRPYPRAEEISAIGSAVQAQTEATDRIALYTYGEVRYDYSNQFRWYSKRYWDYLMDPDSLSARLSAKEERFFVVDRFTFQNVVVPSGVEVRKLVESANWIFFKKL